MSSKFRKGDRVLVVEGEKIGLSGSVAEVREQFDGFHRIKIVVIEDESGNKACVRQAFVRPESRPLR